MQSRLGLAVIGILGGVTWLLSHGYQGIFHDGYLYALQALARLHPELTRDAFLRFGSQDRFSIFSPLYAFAIHNVGFETAAASLTLVFQLTFLAGAWALARTLVSPACALLGVCVLIAIPGTYGADRVFFCMETFLTPRMAAESLALAGMAAVLASRGTLAAVLILAAALVHPIMAAASMACLYVLYAGMGRPRLALTGAAAAVVVYAALTVFVGGERWGRFDPYWFELVDTRSPYLFVSHWRLDDWAPVCVALATLSVAARACDDRRVRSFATAVAMTILLGYALTLVGCDWLHLVLPTQAQPWRWQWLGTVVSALLLPSVVVTLWRLGPHGRTSALLLLAAWIFAVDLFAMVAAMAAVAAFFLMGRLKINEARHIVWGSWALLVIAGAWRIASNLEFTDVHYLDLRAPQWVLRTMSFAHDGSAPLALIAITWHLMVRRRRAALLAIGVGAAALGLALLPYVWAMWTVSEYSARTMASFAPLRARIRPGADVFWPEFPAGAWALLDAPSYLSVVQTSGLVFSRETAAEFERRAAALKPVIAPSSFMDWDGAAEHMNLSKEQLARVCAMGEFNFLVTRYDLGIASVADASIGEPPRLLHLYRCAQPSG